MSYFVYNNKHIFYDEIGRGTPLLFLHGNTASSLMYAEVSKKYSQKKYNIGFICGFFDIIHDGHIDILRKAKGYCNHLIVAVGTDEFMLVRKHRESVLTYEQRVEIVKAIRYVDEVVSETDLDKIAAYQKYKFDVMFAGDDHVNEPIYVEATRQLKLKGVDTIYIARNKKISSSDIRNKINRK